MKYDAGPDHIKFVEAVSGDGGVDVVVCDAGETWK